MGRTVYLGLWLLGCFVFGLNGTPVEDDSEDEVAAKASCPSEAVHVRGYCYEFFRQSLTWDSAEAECQRLRSGGHLASFSSMREEKTVSTYIRRFGTIYYAWIGMNAMPFSNTLIWEWSDHSPYTSGSPLWDNRSPSTSVSSLECMIMYNIMSPSSSTRWSQQNCESSFPFVCKYRA
ncbi:snaclec agglucetin subunit beta-1-like [Paroedura picta]|uniref:snaclec agglucetin subunit beta-1-like n=1 Tax=Paroedura picta TaxID=143630 RepID=UPI004055F4A1